MSSTSPISSHARMVCSQVMAGSSRAAMFVSLASLFVLLAIGPALAQTTFGTLSNFDVFNDTGSECHGFEIELDGLTSANITYKFGVRMNVTATLR
jgi:hypothetical protein